MFKKKCFHCELFFNDKKEFTIVINEKTQSLCCPGCLAVSKFIIDNGLGDYYSYRNKPNFTVNENFFKNEIDFKIYDEISFKNRFLKKETGNFSSIVLIIDGITCAACTWLIERHFNNLNGIIKIFLNLATRRTYIKFDENKIKISFILNELRKLGYIAYPYTPKQQEVFRENEYKRELKKIIIAALGMAQVMMLSVALYIGELYDIQKDFWVFIRWFCFFLTFPVLFFSGSGILYNSLINLRSFNFGMDTTISLSLIIAFFASFYNLIFNFGEIYFDSVCMFIFFLLISRFLEMKARHHSGEITYSLQNASLDKINLLTEFGAEKIISLDELKLNNLIIIKQGEMIPVDGKIINGKSNIIESMITGESIPIYKEEGDDVFSGTINIDNKLIVKATKLKGDFIIDIITNLLEKTGSVKSKTNIMANFISGYFVLIVIILSIFISFIWIKLGHENVLNITLSMLVVACPCALSLATPVAITSSINALAKKGFLISKEHVLEELDSISDIVFDKTGTLTINNFEIKKIKLNKNINIKNVLSIAVSLEKDSKHPISKAFINFKIIKNIKIIDDVLIKSVINKGIEGVINNKLYRIGKSEFIKNWTEKFENEKFLKKGIWIILADKKNIIAWFNLINPLRKNLDECVNNLKKMKINLHILSGDSSKNVDYIANKLEIKNFKKNFSSEQKVKYIKNLKDEFKKVMMIGDGINDAIAMKEANISVSMGSASDLTKINSDVVLLNNNLINICLSIKHGIKNKKIIKQNITWAVFYNIFGLLLAGLDILTPYYSAIGMSISSLIVVFNSLRLRNL